MQDIERKRKEIEKVVRSGSRPMYQSVRTCPDSLMSTPIYSVFAKHGSSDTYRVEMGCPVGWFFLPSLLSRLCPSR